MRNIPSPLSGLRSPFGKLGFSPLALFAANEPGWLYDNSDMSTLFQDSEGTTPVTAVGQPVGLQLDKSKGLVLGPELVTNGDFSAGSTGWTSSSWTFTGGVATYPDTINDFFRPATGFEVPLVGGKSYIVTFNLVSSVAPASVALTNVDGTASYTPITALSGNGPKQFVISPAASTTNIRIYGYTSSGGPFSLDNISVKELAGTHRTQSTAASRPTFACLPVTGRRNLRTYTEQFDNAAWVKSGATVTPNAASAPDGNTSADALVSISGASFGVNNTGLPMSAGNYTSSVYAKANGFNYLKLTWLSGANGTDYAVFNLASGVVTGGVYTAATISPVGNGWYRCSITSLCASTAAGGAYLWMSDGTLSRGAGVTGDGTSGIYLWGAQLELGSTATNYQAVSSIYDITESGVQTAYGLYYDGVDDFMVTPTITPGTDKVQVFAGVRKLSDAAVAQVCELSASVLSNAGSFYLFAPAAATPTFAFASKGTVQATASASGFTAPTTKVLTGLGDISGDRATLRVNGTQVHQLTSDQGTGNYLAYPAYFGRRGGTTLPFNGYTFREVGRFGPNLDAATIANVENWINQNTGAY